MNNISQAYLQHRQSTGSHCQWHERKPGRQHAQITHECRPANTPVLSVESQIRRSPGQHGAQLRVALHAVRSSNDRLAIFCGRAEARMTESRMSHADALHPRHYAQRARPQPDTGEFGENPAQVMRCFQTEPNQCAESLCQATRCTRISTQPHVEMHLPAMTTDPRQQPSLSLMSDVVTSANDVQSCGGSSGADVPGLPEAAAVGPEKRGRASGASMPLS